MDNIFPNRETETRFFFIIAGALAFFILVSFVLGTRVERGSVSVPTRLAATFPTVTLEAKSAYVYDLRTGKVLYEKNPETRLPLASIAKLMSAVVALDLSPTSYGTVKVTNKALENYGDSGLLSEEKWTLKNLLDFSLLTSSNDGIRAVALSLAALDKAMATDDERLGAFVLKMNEKASELGLKNTYFWNETGLDESSVKNGAYGSAEDVSKLLGYFLETHPEALEATREVATTVASMSATHEAKNTNMLVSGIPGVLGSKTGFTDIAGGNVTFAFDPELGRPIVITVLGSSAEGRFADAAKLINATMQYIHTQ